MGNVIDLTKKRNRIVLALDIFLGTIFFSECWPTEPMSSYFWRCGKTAWVKRDDIATLRLRLPHAIPSAVLATADTLAGVLDQCQSDYRALAEVADGHASDVQTLMEAWPK